MADGKFWLSRKTEGDEVASSTYLPMARGLLDLCDLINPGLETTKYSRTLKGGGLITVGRAGGRPYAKIKTPEQVIGPAGGGEFFYVRTYGGANVDDIAGLSLIDTNTLGVISGDGTRPYVGPTSNVKNTLVDWRGKSQEDVLTIEAGGPVPRYTANSVGNTVYWYGNPIYVSEVGVVGAALYDRYLVVAEMDPNRAVVVAYMPYRKPLYAAGRLVDLPSVDVTKKQVVSEPLLWDPTVDAIPQGTATGGLVFNFSPDGSKAVRAIHKAEYFMYSASFPQDSAMHNQVYKQEIHITQDIDEYGEPILIASFTTTKYEGPGGFSTREYHNTVNNTQYLSVVGVQVSGPAKTHAQLLDELNNPLTCPGGLSSVQNHTLSASEVFRYPGFENLTSPYVTWVTTCADVYYAGLVSAGDPRLRYGIPLRSDIKNAYYNTNYQMFNGSPVIYSVTACSGTFTWYSDPNFYRDFEGYELAVTGFCDSAENWRAANSVATCVTTLEGTWIQDKTVTDSYGADAGSKSAWFDYTPEGEEVRLVVSCEGARRVVEVHTGSRDAPVITPGEEGGYYVDIPDGWMEKVTTTSGTVTYNGTLHIGSSEYSLPTLRQYSTSGGVSTLHSDITEGSNITQTSSATPAVSSSLGIKKHSISAADLRYGVLVFSSVSAVDGSSAVRSDLLWVKGESYSIPNQAGENTASCANSGVFASYPLPTSQTFGDMTISSNGSVLLTYAVELLTSNGLNYLPGSDPIWSQAFIFSGGEFTYIPNIIESALPPSNTTKVVVSTSLVRLPN